MDLVELHHGRVDLLRGLLLRDDDVVPLSTKEVELVAYLARQPGRVVGWDELHREVWHHGPSVMSRAAYFTWRRLVQKLEREPERPTNLIGHYGDGVSFVPPGGSRPLPSPPTPSQRTNLGADGTTFVGRGPELARVEAAFEDGARLVVIVGPGGAGKTRLARRAAAAQLGTGDVWVCDLADCPPGGVRARVAATIGLGQADALVSALEARAALVILDEAERVVSEVGGFAGELLAQTRAVRLLVTSRERTRRVDEVIVEVGPLQDADAVELFVDRVHQSDPAFDADAAELLPLVRGLDGLPLAIELAAARARVLAPSELVRQLDHRFDLLRRRGDPGPHGSLWAAIERSWELLDPPHQRTMAQLAVFRGGFTLAAAEAVVDEERVVDRVEALCDASLVHPVPGPLGIRFAMYESLGAFADQHLLEPDRTAARERHATWFAGRSDRWLRAADEGDPTAGRAIAADRANLEAVLDHVADDDRAAACAEALAWDSPDWTRLRAVVDRLVTRPGPRRARLLSARVRLHLRTGRIDLAQADADALLAWAPDDPDALLDQAAVATARGAPSEALTWLDRIEPRATTVNQQLQQRSCRATALLDLGRAREARTVALDHLTRSRALGLGTGTASARLNVALADLALGRPAAAAAELEEVRTEFARYSVHGEAVALNVLGCARLELGDFEGAEVALEESRALHRKNGAVGRITQVEANLALARRGLGRSRDALPLVRRVLAAHRAAGNGRGELVALLNLALDAMACDERAEADQALAEAERLAVGSPQATLRVQCLLAVRHGSWGTAAEADRALDPVRALSLEGESAALRQVAEGFVALAHTREGRIAAPVAAPPLDRFHVVRFLWELLARS